MSTQSLNASPILIAGPTASGKSALAIKLAEQLDGAVINADSQQIYDEWRILSARPTAEDEARVPHFLFGHVSVAQDYTVGDWLRDVAATLAICESRRLRPIIAGGTGLYFKSLTEGLAPIPAVPPAVRSASEALFREIGLDHLAERLRERDPETAERLDLANPARVLRAWEVIEATGRGLAAWQAETGPALLPLDQCFAFALVPDRDRLYRRCDQRFDVMISARVLEEVATVVALGLPSEKSGLKLLGAPELSQHLAGNCTLETATEAAKTATRRYAKRQMTWIRNQMSNWQAITRAGDISAYLAPDQSTENSEKC